MITETDDITAALAAAARAWPEAKGNPGILLRRLILAGHDAVRDERQATARLRHEALARARGALTGDYGPDYLTELREDWPA